MQLTEIAEASLQDYEKGKVHFTPVYPGVLVRVLPKPAFFGMLILPEAYRNKPVYEGVVIKTYAPKTVTITNHATSEEKRTELVAMLRKIRPNSNGDDPIWDHYDALKAEIVKGFTHSTTLDIASDLQPGDHVLFPYWSGQPVPGLSEEEYRVLPDRNIFNKLKNDTGEPFAVLTYEQETTEKTLFSIIDETLATAYDGKFDDELVAKAVDKVHQTFDLIPKNLVSKLDYVEPNKPS